MASTQLNKEISSLQANTILPALENCLLEVDAASSSEREGNCDRGSTWLQACAALLEHSAVLAQTSSFLQLEVTQLLQRHLDRRPSLAEAVLSAQLQIFLQHPVALQQLLRAVPPNEPSQTLAYKSLCTCLTPGGNAIKWASATCKGQALQVVRSCASWELQKLVAEPSSASTGHVKLAAQLPWLLHLLLLTDCAAAEERGDAPGSSYGSACDDDSAARSEGTNHGGVPSSSPPAQSADHASSGGPAGGTPGGPHAHRESANFSVISTSEPASGIDSEVHGAMPTPIPSGCLASLEAPPGADQAAFRAAATVLAHLRHAPTLCALLGLQAEPDQDACTSQDGRADAEHLGCSDTYAEGGAEEGTPVLGLLAGSRQEAVADQATLQERLAVTQQLTEVLLQALLLPCPVAEAILAHAKVSAVPSSAGRELSTTGVSHRESTVLDLLRLHMQLVNAQQVQLAPGEAGEQTAAHLRTQALLTLMDIIRAAMQRQETDSRRARRRSNSHSAMKDGEGPQKCVAPEVATHAMTLLAATPGLVDTSGSDSVQGAPVSRDGPSESDSGATHEEGTPQDMLSRALRLALAMYDISLAGPQLGVNYAESSKAAASLDAALRRTRQQERFGELGVLPEKPDSCQPGDAPAVPASTVLGKRERLERKQSGIPSSAQQSYGTAEGSGPQQRACLNREQSAPSISGQITPPASGAHAPTKKRRIVPEAVVPQNGQTEQPGRPPGDTQPSQSGCSNPVDSRGQATSCYTGSELGKEEEGPEGDSGEEEASPLLQRGMLAAQEKEAWWEHYIAVKLDLVENVLNDDVAPEEDSGCQLTALTAADDMTTPMPGLRRQSNSGNGTPSGAVVACMSQRRMAVADVAFREPAWQAMHAASLRLLKRVILKGSGGGREQCEGVIRQLRQAAPEPDVLASVRNASLLIQPSCGMDTYQAAISGAKAAPVEALPVFFAVRLGRYLSGSGEPPEPDLAAAYLAALEALGDLANESAPLRGSSSAKKLDAAGKARPKQTAPRQLLAKLLLALLDCGDIAIGRMPPGAESAKRLIRLVLAGFDAPNSLVLAGSALVGLSQGMLDLKRRRPHWASAYDAGWHDAWFNAAETAEPAAAVAAAGQLLRTVADGFQLAPGTFRVAADVIIMACRAAECWEGLEAEEMEGTLGDLLQLAAVVQAQCTAATAQLLQLLSLPPGGDRADEDNRGARDNSMAAAYGPDLAEALLGYCQWLSKTRPHFQSMQVAELERQAIQGCKAGHSMVLDHLAASADAEPDAEGNEDTSLQALVCEWLGEAYEDMAAHGVASFEAEEPDQDADELLHDSALTDHSMQTDAGRAEDGPRPDSKGVKQRRKPRSSNPFVQAAMAEMAAHWGNRPSKKRPEGTDEGDDVSGDDVSDDEDNGDDLDDFVVCKPGRDYRALFAQQFKYSCAEMPRSLFRRPL